jgi:hypothetical protein
MLWSECTAMLIPLIPCQAFSEELDDAENPRRQRPMM